MHALLYPLCDVRRPPPPPLQDRWDARHLTSNTRKLKNYTAAKALARQYAEVGRLATGLACNRKLQAMQARGAVTAAWRRHEPRTHCTAATHAL